MTKHRYARSPRPHRAALLIAVIGFLALGQWVQAAPRFPQLTGRVVDNAALLSTPEHERLTGLLAEYESKTSNQVMVVTLESLQGYAIEDFGYQLGRHWGIGKAGKDNGVLLIVAPTERKVRIEAGYGLEGILTDALCHDIIEAHILPAFKAGDYETGIRRGTESIIAALGGTYSSSERDPQTARPLPLSFQDIWWQILLGILFVGFVIYLRATQGGSGGPSSSGGGFSARDINFGDDRSFGGGGGFSGGGGSFGGGGASGSW